MRLRPSTSTPLTQPSCVDTVLARRELHYGAHEQQQAPSREKEKRQGDGLPRDVTRCRPRGEVTPGELWHTHPVSSSARRSNCMVVSVAIDTIDGVKGRCVSGPIRSLTVRGDRRVWMWYTGRYGSHVPDLFLVQLVERRGLCEWVEARHAYITRRSEGG
jgi:hypothetical protein